MYLVRTLKSRDRAPSEVGREGGTVWISQLTCDRDDRLRECLIPYVHQ